MICECLDRIQKLECEASLLEAIQQDCYAEASHDVIKNCDDARIAFTTDLLVSKIPAFLNIPKDIKKPIIDEVLKHATNLYLERLNNDNIDGKKFNFVTIIDIHYSVEHLAKTIKIIIDLTNIGKIDFETRNNELDIDHHAMNQILDQMKPEETMDMKQWQNQVTQLKIIYRSLNPNKKIQDKWLKLTIVSLYFQTVWCNETNDEKMRGIVMDKAIHLWERLKEDIEFVESEKTFMNVLKVIIKTSEKVNRMILLFYINTIMIEYTIRNIARRIQQI